MRTYDKFIVEATEADIKAMGGTDETIAKLRARKAARGGKGFGSSGSTGSHFHNKQKPGALAKRTPGGRGVGTTQSSYKTGPLAKRAADKGSALVAPKNTSYTGDSQKGNNPGSTKKDGNWGRKEPGDWDSTGTKKQRRQSGNTPVTSDKPPHKSSFRDGIKQGLTGGLKGGSVNQRKAAQRALGRKIGTGVRNAPGKFVKNALKNNVRDVDSKEGKEGKSAGRMQKQY